jgi:hypothetical protein
MRPCGSVIATMACWSSAAFRSVASFIHARNESSASGDRLLGCVLAAVTLPPPSKAPLALSWSPTKHRDPGTISKDR